MIICPSGRTMFFLFVLFMTRDSIIETGPTLPMNIVRITTAFPQTPAIDAAPALSPAVEKAEAASKRHLTAIFVEPSGIEK